VGSVEGGGHHRPLSPEYDDESRKILRIARDWVREAGIDNFYDAQGICHVVLPSAAISSRGCSPSAATAIRPPARLCRLHVRHRLDRAARRARHRRDLAESAHTIAMDFDGAFARGVSAKDVMLFLIAASAWTAASTRRWNIAAQQSGSCRCRSA